MINGVTASGFEYSVSERLKEDFRFVIAYSKLSSDNPAEQMSAPVELTKLVLGESGAKRLYAHVAEPDGMIPTERVMTELTEIVAAAGNKNKEIKN